MRETVPYMGSKIYDNDIFNVSNSSKELQLKTTRNVHEKIVIVFIWFFLIENCLHVNKTK
jgi:hypothetical protein